MKKKLIFISNIQFLIIFHELLKIASSRKGCALCPKRDDPIYFSRNEKKSVF